MNILVTAASKHGATAEIAEAIAATLTDHGLDASVVAPDDVGDVASYDAVVLGSAVYAGHWLKQATDLVDRLAGELASLPVWLFSSGPVGVPLKPTDDTVQVSDIVDKTGAAEHRVFAGAIDKAKLGFAERAMVTALRVTPGDYRDFEDIRAWAAGIADRLTAAGGGAAQAPGTG